MNAIQSLGMPGRQHRWLFGAAMLVFLLTIVVGILNGLDLVDFDRNTLLTHVHAGTLGWITMSVLAVSLLLFGDPGRPGPASRTTLWLSLLAVVSIPIYVVVFWTGDIAARAITSLPVFVVVAGYQLWLLAQARRVTMTTPRLAVLAAFVVLTIGSVFGTLYQLQLWTGQTLLAPGPTISAHVTAMAFGYLVLVGMAITEWRLLPERPVGRAGATQVGALFVGSLLLVIGAITNNTVLLQANTLFQFVAVIVFAVRMWPAVRQVRPLGPGPARFYRVAAVFVAIDIGILIFLIAQLLSGAYGPIEEEATLTKIPIWLIFALDHAIFVGVMSNAILGLLFEQTAAGGVRLRYAEPLAFWGMNLGLIGFVAGLALEQVILKQVFSPIMGVGILVGLAEIALRLYARRPGSAG